jgi:eukaryotic-like serine/threonine-protein kinase
MSLEPGTRLGPYEVLSAIDSGVTGPDERYKASDTRVNRVVSLKVLPPELSTPELKARLESDAKAISSLNHPNICALVDVGHHEPSTDFVVAEFVEGETLAERLKRGPLPLKEALTIAIAIADSLDKAHRKGVIHGGLNPSTVLLTAAGPKLLDFGVARLTDERQAPGTSSMAATRTSIPTLSFAPTFAAPYLAPEQLAGAPADARSDIFAFGTLLYEMVTGRPAFREKTVALLIAAVQSVDPEAVTTLQPAVPPALDHIIKRCLSKDPRQRLQTAWDLLAQLQWIAEGGSQIGIPAPVVAGRGNHDRILWAAVAAVAVLVVGMMPSALDRFQSAPEPQEVRFLAPGLPPGATPIAISPDGRWLVAATQGGPATGLSLDSVTPQVLIRGIPFQPFFSADSRSIAYFEDGKLKRADIGGGPPQIICDVPAGFSAGAWNRDGVILFPAGGVIHRVLAAGGQPTPITALDESKHETEHLGPSLLPDGRHFLFLAASSQTNESAVYVGSTDSKERTRLFASDSKAVYASPGYVLFNRGDTVFAQAFDANTLTLKGEPIRVASGVPLRIQAGNASAGITRSANFAVSQTGVLVYRTGAAAAAPAAGAGEQRSLFWFDRAGIRSPSLGPTGIYAGVDLSPDGKRIAVHQHEAAGGDNWVFDIAQGRMQRLTFDATQDNQSPIWSPDGTRIAFASRRNSKWGIYAKLADGTGTEELITESSEVKVPMSWSPDGKLIVYLQTGQAGDVWAVPVTGDKKPLSMLHSQFNESFPQVSPDGKWLAYQSNESGREEIYVKPFPEGPGKWQVSTDGGVFPRWRKDSKELYFVVPPNIMAAEIRVTGLSLQAGVPQTLFALGASPVPTTAHNTLLPIAVTADGRSFLLSQPGGTAPGIASGGLADQIAAVADGGGAGAAPNTVAVVLNWTQMLTKK